MDSYLARIAAEKRNIEALENQKKVQEYLIRIGELANVELEDNYRYSSGVKKKNKGFFLDDTLKRNLDNFLITAVDAKWDSVLILSGMEGSGKTIFSSAICKYLDPTFPGPLIDEGKTPRRRIDRVVFSPQDFFTAVDTAKPKQAIQFDEAILGLMAGDAGMSIQKMLMKKITLIRKKQLYIILVIPSIFSVRMPIAVQRSRYLIHTFSPDGITRGRFKFYNYPRKRALYIKGKRDYNQDSVEPNFMGSFANTNGLFYDEDEYDKKKEHAIQTLMDDSSGSKGVKSSKMYLKASSHRNLLLFYIRSLLEGSHESKQRLQKLIEYHSLYANAKKTTEMLNTPKLNKILKEIFGKHLNLSNRLLLEYLKQGETYAGGKGDLLDEEEPGEIGVINTPKEEEDAPKEE